MAGTFKDAVLGGTAFSRVYDDEQYALGTIRVQSADDVTAADATHFGDRTWIFVFNDETSTAYAAGNVIVRDASTTPAGPFDGVINTDDAAAVGTLGVAQHAIAAGKYGWIVKEGVCEVMAGDTGTDFKGATLATAASGDAQSAGVDVMAAGEEHQVIGYGLDAGGGSAGNLITAYIRV
jgi:hypothetical protein